MAQRGRHGRPGTRGNHGTGEVGELVGLLRRTLLPVGVFLGAVLGLYGGTGHDLDVILQDRFPDDSEWSGLLTILFGSALLVCAGVALTGVLLARTERIASEGAGGDADPALRAGTAIAVLAIVIAFDDMMMVHDAVLPGSGVPETVALGLWAAVGLALGAWAFVPLRRTGLALVFLAAMALLGASVVGDIAEELLKEPAPLVARVVGYSEDTVKFVAYAALCHLCVRLMRRTAPTARETRRAPVLLGDPVTVPLLTYGVVGGTPTPTGHATPVPASPQ